MPLYVVITKDKGDAMSAEEQTQDPHDNAFGAAADRDVNIVGSLDGKGVTDEGLSDEPTRHPRGGEKAKSASTSAGHETGAEKAAQNREEDPPA
jgi:hypothetical protein